MFTPLICGSNFQDQEDDEELELLDLCSETKKSSRKPTRRHSFSNSRTKDTKNPYADRGLDKFSALLAELDSKRQKIYTQKGSEDISLLGFVYSNSSDYKPIVIRLRDKKQDRTKIKTENNSQVSDKGAIDAAKGDSKKLSRIESNRIKNEKVGFLWGDILKFEKLRRPSYYVPVIMMLILVFLAVFGRSFAILCTCLGWYIIPTISLKLKKSRGMKKEYVKGLGDNHGLPLSPNSVLIGGKWPPRQGSPPRQGHGRSS